jgi:hypothetical protein
MAEPDPLRPMRDMDCETLASEITSASGSVDYEKPGTLKERTRKWFKQQLEKTSILMLFVGLCTIVITATGLGFTIAGYILQKHGSQPELASAGSRVDLRDPKSVLLEFTNIGKRPARRVFATFFGVNKDRNWNDKQKLGEASKQGIGKDIVPGRSADVSIPFSGQTPDLFLACVIYYDEDNRLLRQAFLVTRGPVEGTLDELETPNAEVCN